MTKLPLIILLFLTPLSQAQITRTATFENYTEGQSFKPTLLDPLSSIYFYNATGGSNSFTIEYSSTQFGGGNYLSNGGYDPGPNGSWTGDFGFSADLPIAANRVSFDLTHLRADISGVVLTGYSNTGTILAQEIGPFTAKDPFTFVITSTQYNIAHFTVTANNIETGYDNISYTILPEPSSLSLLLLPPALALPRRRFLRSVKPLKKS